MSYTPPPPPPDPSAYGVPKAGARPGELLDRFVARLIDGVVVGVVYVIVAIVLIAGVVLSSGSSYLVNFVTAVVLAALQLGYFVFMETTRGQTIGKMVMKLRVVGPHGGNPTVEESVRRNIWLAAGLASIVPIVGGLVGGVASLVAIIMIAVGINSDTVNRQAWHDKFAGGTRVIKEG